MHDSRQLTTKISLSIVNLLLPIAFSTRSTVNTHISLERAHHYLEGFLHFSQGRGVAVPEVGGALGILEECMELGTLRGH